MGTKLVNRRDTLRIFGGSSAALMGNLALHSTGFGVEAEVLSHQVISQSPNLYCGWPTLTRRANGELILVFSGGREEHVCPFGRVDMMRSRDNGKLGRGRERSTIAR